MATPKHSAATVKNKTTLRAAPNRPIKDRNFLFGNPSVAPAEPATCSSRGRGSFIKHLLLFSCLRFFNSPRHGCRSLFQCRLESGIRCGGYGRNCRFATARIRTRRHKHAFSGCGTSQAGGVRPPSHWEATRTAYLVPRIIGPCASVVLKFRSSVKPLLKCP